MSDPTRMFPLLRGARFGGRRHDQQTTDHLRQSIPWAMIAPHEEQARRNHDQSLQMLAERGGLSPGEACDVLLGRRWNTTPVGRAEKLLEELVVAYEAGSHP